jgi:Flp pilus assembly protein TadB
MGDSFHDPVDHQRTTRPRVGESIADAIKWPGYFLIATAVGTFVGCLAAFGTGHTGQGVVTGVIAIVAVVSGLVWLMVESRRVRRIEKRWQHEHAGVRR